MYMAKVYWLRPLLKEIRFQKAEVLRRYWTGLCNWLLLENTWRRKSLTLLEECNRILNQVKLRNELVLSTDRVMEMNKTILNNLQVSEGVKAGGNP